MHKIASPAFKAGNKAETILRISVVGSSVQLDEMEKYITLLQGKGN